jgi:hypothetical protein
LIVSCFMHIHAVVVCRSAMAWVGSACSSCRSPRESADLVLVISHRSNVPE